MIKNPETNTKIRFKDCDPMGHLYNTRYIEYMLEAREDQISEHYGISLMDYADQRKLAWVIIKHEILFVREARRGENVIITTGVNHLTDKTLQVEYLMWSENRDQLKAILWSRFLHLDLQSKRPVPHPADIQDMLNEVLVNPTNNNIEERKNYLVSHS